MTKFNFLAGCRRAQRRPLRAVLLPMLFGLAALSATVSANAQQLFVGDTGDNTVKSFSGPDGADRRVFVQSGSGGLSGPTGIIYTGGELLVVNQNAGLPLSGEVLRFDGRDGAFIGKLVPASDPNAPYAPRGIVRGGPDNDFYVADAGTQNADCDNEGSIRQYDHAGRFVGNLDRHGFRRGFYPRGLVFGPDGLLYVSAFGCPYSKSANAPLIGYILRFNARTRAFVDVFASNRSVAGLHRPEGLVFDNEGNVWVASFRADSDDSDKILKLDGRTGALLDSLVLSSPPAARAYAQAILFGPDGRLYIPITGGDPSTAGELRRCDVKRKSCEIVAPAGKPLQSPFYLIFRNSDPATLDYPGNR